MSLKTSERDCNMSSSRAASASTTGSYLFPTSACWHVAFCITVAFILTLNLCSLSFCCCAHNICVSVWMCVCVCDRLVATPWLSHTVLFSFPLWPPYVFSAQQAHRIVSIHTESYLIGSNCVYDITTVRKTKVLFDWFYRQSLGQTDLKNNRWSRDLYRSVLSGSGMVTGVKRSSSNPPMENTHLCTHTHTHTVTQTPAFSVENQWDNYKAISRQILSGSHRGNLAALFWNW